VIPEWDRQRARTRSPQSDLEVIGQAARIAKSRGIDETLSGITLPEDRE
jgi:hypothetical protein